MVSFSFINSFLLISEYRRKNFRRLILLCEFLAYRHRRNWETLFSWLEADFAPIWNYLYVVFDGKRSRQFAARAWSLHSYSLFLLPTMLSDNNIPYLSEMTRCHKFIFFLGYIKNWEISHCPLNAASCGNVAMNIKQAQAAVLGGDPRLNSFTNF